MTVDRLLLPNPLLDKLQASGPAEEDAVFDRQPTTGAAAPLAALRQGLLRKKTRDHGGGLSGPQDDSKHRQNYDKANRGAKRNAYLRWLFVKCRSTSTYTPPPISPVLRPYFSLFSLMCSYALQA